MKLIQTLDTGKNRFGVESQPGFELYDLQSDPAELVNIYSERPEVARILSERLDRWSQSSESGNPDELPAFSEEQRKMLERLGYVE